MVSEEEIKKKIEEFETLRQTYLSIIYQIERLTLEYEETKNAIEELQKIKGNEKVYKLLGNILVESNKEELLKELNEKKDILDIRINSLKKQEGILKDRLIKLQNEIENLIGKSKA